MDDAKRGGQRTTFHLQCGDIGLQLEQIPPEGGSDDEGDGIDVVCEERAFDARGEDLVDTQTLHLQSMHALSHALMEQMARLRAEVSSLQDAVSDMEAS